MLSVANLYFGVAFHPQIYSEQLKRAGMLFDRVVCREPWFAGGTADDHPRLFEFIRVVEISSLPDSQVARAVVKAASAERTRIPQDERLSFDSDTLSRMIALRLQEQSSDTYVPLLRGQFPFSSVPSPTAGKGALLRVALQRLPLPSSDTPWGAIFDWRDDGDARRKFQRLRQWIGQVSRQISIPEDAEDELAGLVDDYEQYMSLQHRKIARSRLEIFTVTTAQVLEDLSRLRLSNAMQRLFDLAKSNIVLEEAEFAAPGRAVAYIALARRRFARTS